MSKQTAVEWLVDEINKINVSTEARLFINKLKDQAKAMEREQIEQAYKQGCWDEIEERMDSYSNELYKTYYNKTYKGGEK